MMRVVALTIVLAALITPSIGISAGDQSPVVVNSCNIIYDNANATSTIRGLDVQFTNESSKTATVVTIRTDINGTTQDIRDQGNFAPGIEIHHQYRAGGQQFALPTVLASIFGSKPEVTCHASSVHFADGTRWPEAVAQGNSSAVSVNPVSLALSGTGNAGARLVLASGGGPLSMSSNCGTFATVELLGTTSHDIAFRVTPKGPGTCSITVRDENDNVVTVPVTVQ